MKEGEWGSLDHGWSGEGTRERDRRERRRGEGGGEGEKTVQ